MNRRILLFLIIFLSSCFYFLIRPSFRGAQIIRSDPYDRRRGCLMPIINQQNPIYNWHTARWLFSQLTCPSDKNWLIWSTNGSLTFNPAILQKYEGDIKCTISYVKRVDDWTVTKEIDSDVFDSRKFLYFRPKYDFFDADCHNPQTKDTKSHAMMGVGAKSQVLKRSEPYRRKDDNHGALNILFFGFDSVSRVNFIHNLPKVYQYLTEELDATVLNRHNIVGDGTPINLVAMLTGTHYATELQDTRKGVTNQTVDGFPFIMKELMKKNYVTSFVEDGPTYLGTFNYRLNGFKEWPVDHEGRSFMTHLEHKKLLPVTSYGLGDHCVGSELKLDVIFNWLKMFFHSYPKHVNKFVFGWHGEYSHDYHSFVSMADNPTLTWLKSLKEEGILDNTILFLISDHGHRFDYVRKTLQGKYEERLPFFSITLPKWFKHKYPNAYRALKINGRDRFTTQFDIYSTLQTIIHNFNDRQMDTRQKHKKMTRSMSLFSEIPIQRTCSDAGLTPHWCACSDWQTVHDFNSDPISLRASHHVVSTINKLIRSSGHGDDCSKLSVKEIIRIQTQSMINSQTNAKESLYEIQLMASPGDGLFEATFKYFVDRDLFELNIADISRINMYGSSSACVMKSAPHLVKYCSCK